MTKNSGAPSNALKSYQRTTRFPATALDSRPAIPVSPDIAATRFQLMVVEESRLHLRATNQVGVDPHGLGGPVENKSP
jgi:hypothetical protein